MRNKSKSGELPVEREPYVKKDGSHLVACFPDEYNSLLDEKVTKLRELMSWDQPIDVFESPKSHFRMRANFQMWHEDAKNRVPSGFFYSMTDNIDKRCQREVTNFPRGTELINKLMPELMVEIKASNEIFENLFEVRFMTTQTNEAVITLCYKKPLCDNWLTAAEALSKKLGMKILGRARKVLVIAGGEDETLIETYTVKGQKYRFYQTEGAFSQPNAAVCEKMITWAMDRTAGSEEQDLLELYCGGGTFTAPLSRNFRSVLATEISKASVELATKSFALNDIKNIKIARLSSEEFGEFYAGRKSYSRVEDVGIRVKNYNISTVLVDPPRAGLDPGTCSLISQFEKIVYISCNPETLARDVAQLLLTHTVERVAAFDQFPYTHHLEGGVFLVKRPAAALTTEVAAVVTGDTQQVVEADESEPVEKRQRTA